MHSGKGEIVLIMLIFSFLSFCLSFSQRSALNSLTRPESESTSISWLAALVHDNHGEKDIIIISLGLEAEGKRKEYCKVDGFYFPWDRFETRPDYSDCCLARFNLYCFPVLQL
ncbi:hypothetical protein BJY04DRAFT_70727 [Aspergillus karnatakaensis]|uniref:uncharacterized protein n=1 Tax=Aspergillus karnatakaensis TaxID=1810916 RepID=UPI003CCD1A45